MNAPRESKARLQVTLPGHLPDALDSIHLNAYLEYAVGDFDEAGKQLTLAIRRNPNESAYHFDLGLTRWRAGDLPGALEAFANAGTLNPTFADAFYNAGVVALRLGQTDEAADHFRVARHADAFLALRCVFDALRLVPAERRALLERYGWRIPTKDFPAVLDAIGFGLMQRGQHDEAATYLQRALDIEQTAQRHAALGTILKQMKKFGEARRQFELALKLDPDSQAISEAVKNG